MNILTEIHDRREDSYKILDDASSLPETDILQRSQTRRRTDVIFLYAFIGCVILLIPFLIYTLSYCDINRLKGYDECGNICGQKNIKYDQWNCTGQDLTLQPVYIYRSCTSDGPSPFKTRLSGEEIFIFIHRSAWKIFLVTFVPLALCLILVVLFRYFPAVAVWSVLIISWLVFTAVGLLYLLITAVFWHVFIVTIFCVVSLLLLISWTLFHLSHIRLAMALLREATRPFFEVRKMCYVSLGALSTSVVVTVIFTIVHFHIMTSGKLGSYSYYLDYLFDGGMITAVVLNSVVAVWAVMVVVGVQDMATSGIVAQWYTTKNQEDLSEAVPSSLRVTVINHLGTIVLGSLLMVIMFIPRLVLQFLAIFSCMKVKADAGLRCLDAFFTNYSYIITAKCATNFVQSGRQAFRLLKLSIGNTRDLNNFVNFIIATAQSLIVFVSTMGVYITLYYHMGFYGLYSEHFALVGCAIAVLCSYAFLGTLKVSSNTLFFCAIDDLLRNKEADQPFTMTMEELVDGSNKLLLQKVQSSPAPNIPEKRLYIKIFVFGFVGVATVLFFVAYFI